MKKRLLGILISVLMIATCAFTLTACGGGSSKIEKITFSSTKEQVKEILGEPYQDMGDGWLYYGDNFIKLIKQGEKLEEQYAEALLNYDFEKMMALQQAIDEFELKMLETEGEMTQIVFSNGKVEDLVYDKNAGGLVEEKKATPETPATIKILGSDGQFISLSIKYKDGSFKLKKVDASLVENMGAVYGVSTTDFMVLEFADSWGTYTTSWYADKLTKLIIPDGTTEIKYSAFKNNTDLREVVFPSSLTEIGSSAFEGCTSLSNVNFPDGLTEIGSSAFKNTALTEIVIPDSVTKIYDSAFYGCYKLAEVYNLSALNITKGSKTNGYAGYYAKVIHTDIEEESILSKDENGFITYNNDGVKTLVAYVGLKTEITIPNDIEAIEEYAFKDCLIEDITLSASAIAFIPKDSLKTVTITSGDSIGSDAFHGCHSLESIVIPDSVTSIGSDAFNGCHSLESIVIPDSVTSIGYGAFKGCHSLESIVIPDSVTSIGSDAFNGCHSLESIVIPDSVTSIGYGAFKGCHSLESIVIPDSVTSIGSYAFYSCHSLKNIVIPDSVTSIGTYAFGNCVSLVYNVKDGLRYLGNNENKYLYLDGPEENSLISIIIDANCKFIEKYAFSTCDKVIEVYNLSALNITKGSKTNGYAGYYAKVIHTDIEEESILSKDENGFITYNNDGIKTLVAYVGLSTQITIPSDIKAIDKYAFHGCSSLNRVVMSDGVIYIGDCAFSGCHWLRRVVIPDSVTSIGDYAFNSTSLESITFNGTIAEWKDIEIGDYWTRYAPVTYVQCSDGKVTIS